MKGKVVANLIHEKWLWNLVLPCDVSHNLDDLNIRIQGQQKLDLNIRIQGQQKLIFDIFGDVRGFASLSMDQQVFFPSVLAIEMIDFLAENFKIRFSDFRSHSTNIPG
jgi:hypothetical protein